MELRQDFVRLGECKPTPRKQWQVILAYVQEGHRITSGQVWDQFGFSRLSDIVYKIEKHTGIVLKRKRIEVINRYGRKCNVAQYWYEKDS